MGDNNAQGQIVVKVSVQSAEALANLKAFVTQSQATLQVIKAPVSEVTNGMGGMFEMLGKNRMAMMELGHVARASFDGIISGINPARLALMELPRVLQASATAGFKIGIGGILTELATFVPLAGTAVLAATALHDILSRPLPMEAFLEKQNDELKKQIKLVEDINKLKQAGVMTDQQYMRVMSQPSAASMIFEMMKSGLAVPSKSGGEVSAIANAQLAMNTARQQMSGLGETDEGGKKIQDLTEKLTKLKDTAMGAGLVLVNAGKMSKAEFDAMAQSMDEASDKQVDLLVQSLNFENQQKQHKAAEEAFDKGQAEFAKMVAQERSDLGRKLVSEEENWTGDRIELAENEYNEKLFLYTQELYAGEINEQQYNTAVLEASNARDKIREEEHKEILERLAEERKAEQRQIEQSMRNDWRTTDAQKYNNLKGAGYNDKTTQGPDPSSFQEQFLSQMVHIQTQWGTMAQQMGKIFSSNLTTAINATSQAFTKLIMGTMTWKQALQSIESSILNELINAIIKMFEQWIIGMILQYTVGKALAAANLAANAGLAAGESAIWATPATLATIASYGGAAYSAPGIIAAATLETMASVAGREFGGSVTAGTPYIVGEKRAELFVPDQSGTILPYVPTSKSSTTDASTGSGQQMVVHVHSWPDERAAVKYQRDNPVSKHIMLQQLNRYGRPFAPK